MGKPTAASNPARDLLTRNWAKKVEQKLQSALPNKPNEAELRHAVEPLFDGFCVEAGIPPLSHAEFSLASGTADAVFSRFTIEDKRQVELSMQAHETYSQKYCPKQNDVYVVKSGATTGKVAIVDLQEDFNIWSPLAAIRCDPALVLPWFVFHALGSDYFQGLVKASWSHGTQPNIGMEVLENLSVIVPPVPEQRAIVEHIVRETAKLEALRASAKRTIGLLKERRAALIAAAVTGQIDVAGSADSR